MNVKERISFREKVGVIPIEKKMIEVKLRWFRHMQRRLLGALISKVDQIIFSFMRRGKKKIKKDVKKFY